MRVYDGTVHFENSDMNFVAKFGIDEATDMVLDFKAEHDLPFIYDNYQLFDLLGAVPSELFERVKNAHKFYRRITIPKKNGQNRVLYSPDYVLMHYQRVINLLILKNMPVSRYAMAYRSGIGVKQAAAPHTNKKYILKLDIRDFFGSITFDMVMSSAFNSRYFPKNIGYMLTCLCTRKGELPQGAPTSPAISNLVLKSFDTAIGRWCNERNIAYTRYCDDMTFSANFPLNHIYKKVESMLAARGFELNPHKTRHIKNTARQSVMGITVNERTNVSRDYKRDLRQEVYFVLKYGPENVIRTQNKTEFYTYGAPDSRRYLHHLIGRVKYVLYIEPKNQGFKNMLVLLFKKKWEVTGDNDYYF